MAYDLEIESMINKVEKLRQQVKNDTKCMDYYEYLKEFNKNDKMYGWLFINNDMLEEDLLDLVSMYQKPYVLSVMQVYANELENIIIKTKEL